MKLSDSELRYCEVCGEEFVNGANYYKYCKGCAREKFKETKRENWHKNKQRYRPAR